MSTSYLYWLVRYVPDVARGERVNVAVIVGQDGADWAVKVAPNLRRASRLGGDAGTLRPWLDSLAAIIEDYQRPPLEFFIREPSQVVSRAWMAQLSHRFNNVLQVSEPSPVQATSAQEAAEFIYTTLVAVPGPAARSKTRTRILRDLNGFYETSGVLNSGDLLRRPRAMVGRQRGRFDFAVVDGEVDQISQAFAFDVRDTDQLERELQSWNFIVSRLRQDGAQIFSGHDSVAAPAEVPISVGYQEPTPSANSRVQDVFGAAIEAWEGLKVRPVPSTQLELIAQEASQLVAA